MTSQEWTERRESHTQCTPHFTWVEYRYSVRTFMLESTAVRQIFMNYVIWKATMQEQARQEAGV